MAEPFAIVESAVIPLLRNDIDTDQVIPARFLKTTERSGLADMLFHDWRYAAPGVLQEPPFVLDMPAMADRSILLAGDNFGCGSSREHAPWALVAWGVRVVMATSFADIFRSNALKNGLLPIRLGADDHARVRDLVAAHPEAQLSIDAAEQSVGLPDGSRIAFEIDPFAKQMLMTGTDEIGWLLERGAAIDAFEAAHPAAYDTRSPAA